jgi:hypothetical protein
MTQGLIIGVDGRIRQVQYRDLNHLFSQSTNPDFLNCLEEHEISENKVYLIYGNFNQSQDFNRFEFHSCNPMGEVVVITADTNSPVHYDTHFQEFMDYYCGDEELDTYLLEDELLHSGEITTSDDSYDYNDGFLVRDYFDCDNPHMIEE